MKSEKSKIPEKRMAHVDALSRNLEMEEIDVTDLTEAD